MTAIAKAESAGRLHAHATHGENSFGLWQINVEAHPYLGSQDLYDPLTNAKAAYRLSNHGRDISIWSTIHKNLDAPYLRYKNEAIAAAKAYGDPGTGGMWTGTGGYGDRVAASVTGSTSSVAPTPEPATSHSAVTAEHSDAAGTSAVTTAHAPTDTFAGQVERELTAGTNVYLTDTDHGGVSDGVIQASSGDAHGSALLTGFDAEYQDEHSASSNAAPAVDVALDPALAPTAEAESGTAPGSADADAARLAAFLAAANGEVGEHYVWGTKPGPNDAHPTAFDCSGFTRWAASRVGTSLPLGAAGQYRYLKKLGLTIPVSQGMRTPGALLFHFDGEPPPTGGEPPIAHVVVSLGEGETVEAMNHIRGVVRSTSAGRFDFAALVPGITAPTLSELHTAGAGETDSPAEHPTTHATDASSGDGQIDVFLAAIRQHESSDNYTAHAPKGGASGAYQFINSTWATWCNHAGYSQYAGQEAAAAPPTVQDAVAKAMALSAYRSTHDWGAVACEWYIGHQPEGAEWNVVPMPQYGNTITPRQYADDVLARMKKLAPTIAADHGTTTGTANDPTHAAAPDDPSTPTTGGSADAIVAAELAKGTNPFATDVDHTGTSDAYRLIVQDAGSHTSNAESSAEQELLRGFETGYADQHPDLYGDHAP